MEFLADFAPDPAFPVPGDHVSTGDETITPSTELVLSGLVDSLGVVMIVEWIEDRLGREVDPTDVVIEHFETVEAMAAFLGTA
ncbi:MAG: acyl carrier protein [Ilumatobacter fluminis]